MGTLSLARSLFVNAYRARSRLHHAWRMRVEVRTHALRIRPLVLAICIVSGCTSQSAPIKADTVDGHGSTNAVHPKESVVSRDPEIGGTWCTSQLTLTWPTPGARVPRVQCVFKGGTVTLRAPSGSSWTGATSTSPVAQVVTHPSPVHRSPTIVVLGEGTGSARVRLSMEGNNPGGIAVGISLRLRVRNQPL